MPTPSPKTDCISECREAELNGWQPFFRLCQGLMFRIRQDAEYTTSGMRGISASLNERQSGEAAEQGDGAVYRLGLDECRLALGQKRD